MTVTDSEGQQSSRADTNADEAPTTQVDQPTALRWQAVIIAAITAIAGVLTAWLATTGGSPAEASGTQRETSDSATAAIAYPKPSIAITSWTEKPERNGKKAYEFTGTVKDLRDGFYVFVILQKPGSAELARDDESTSWRVSPKAEVMRDNTWRVRWELREPVAGSKWIAAVMGTGTSLQLCACGQLPVVDAASARWWLQHRGPDVARARTITDFDFPKRQLRNK